MDALAKAATRLVGHRFFSPRAPFPTPFSKTAASRKPKPSSSARWAIRAHTMASAQTPDAAARNKRHLRR
jgi:hypothetical protein